MFTTPVVILGLDRRTFIMCAARSLNCSMMDAPGGISGFGKSWDILLVTQRLPFESRATPRTLRPQRKDSTLDGSLAGKRRSVSDAELLTQTRFWASMATPKGDISPATLTMRPSLIRPPGKYSN